MEPALLLEKIKTLPDNLQQEVEDFVEFLKKKHIASSQEKPKRESGFLKGSVLYMAPDFDEPLEDFKDYM